MDLYISWLHFDVSMRHGVGGITWISDDSESVSSLGILAQPFAYGML
jgi:hypothetical protein